MERTFAMRLSELRKNSGTSQKEAAIGLGVSQALLSHYENGIRECGLDFVRRASEYYGVTSDYLLGLSSSKKGLNEGYFSMEDIPEDNKLDALTVYRVTMFLREKLLERPPEHRDFFFKYFSLSMYRFLVAASKAGDVPRSWVSENTPINSKSYAQVMAGVETVLLSAIEKGQRKMRTDPPPQCVKTLVEETEAYLLEELENVVKRLV